MAHEAVTNERISGTTTPLGIVHCFRSPVGGIFRHVRDLIEKQVEAGHSLGVICDNNTGGPFEEDMLAALQPHLKLGLHRISMNRAVGPRDISVIWKLYRQLKKLDIDILHSHGAKGGAYARLIGTALGSKNKRPARLYCPHGGSVHFSQSGLAGSIYFRLERILEKLTDRLIFVSQYERDGYLSKVGESGIPYSLVRNGLRDDEFKPIEIVPEAADFAYIGMLRDLKGVDLFLDALPLVAERTGHPVTAVLIGDGPDREAYKKQAAGLGRNVAVTFIDPMPARAALSLGKAFVVPSRAESMPYIVLETLAAQRPLVATRVGGIPEIFGEWGSVLVEPDNAEALAEAMAGHLLGLRKLASPLRLADRVFRNFSTVVMARDVMAAYSEALATRNAGKAVTEAIPAHRIPRQNIR